MSRGIKIKLDLSAASRQYAPIRATSPRCAKCEYRDPSGWCRILATFRADVAAMCEYGRRRYASLQVQAAKQKTKGGQ